MKKSLIVCVSIFWLFLGGIEVYGEKKNTEKENSISSEEILEEKKKDATRKVTKKFIGRGNTENEKERQRRSLRYSSLEPIGLYAEEGNTLTVEVNGQDSLELVIGSPERNTQNKYNLNQGINMIEVKSKGPIYIINANEGGSVIVSISGATGSLPYFDLSNTDVEDFEKQMSTEINATDVQLISNKAIITVSYEQAKKNIKNPKELMEYYDKFLLAQDKVSGINDNGMTENLVDLHFQHFIEVPRMYMFATQEYMGFNGDAALSRLLKIDNGWGIWHESGHQRQQSPWKWNSVTESTVNIYSMAAQKEITGSITALDKYYPQMHTFLKSENKNFEKQNNDLKMVLFGQLTNTFGDNFYPVLHQYYRRSNLSYSNDGERIQDFILAVSNITGYNMSPYFDQWGFVVSCATRNQTNQLADLPAPIWLNDNQIIKKLPMRLINNVTLFENNINVDLNILEKGMFQGEKLVLIKNDKYVSELTNKIPFYSSLNDNEWHTDTTLNTTDIIRIEVRNSDGTFQLYKGSIIVDQLKNKISGYLSSEEPLSEILTQTILDDIRMEISKITDEDDKVTLFNLLEKLEERYLESLVKDIVLDEKGDLFVEFSNTKFKDYNKIVILGTNKYIAEVSNGTPYYGSINSNIFKISQQENQEKFSIQFRLPHKTYTVNEICKEELILKRDLEFLFTVDNQLKDDVTQKKLDDLRNRISSLSGSLKESLTTRNNYAQKLFFELMVSELNSNGIKVVVSFSNNLYKNYKVVVLEDNKYMAEVTNGVPYYGQLDGDIFTPSKNINMDSLYEIEIRHASGNYRIKGSLLD